MTLPPNIQDVVNEARTAYIEAVTDQHDQDKQKQFARLLEQVGRLLDVTQDQAFDLVAVSGSHE
jgi:pyrroline-5-carboxylate reductase